MLGFTWSLKNHSNKNDVKNLLAATLKIRYTSYSYTPYFFPHLNVKSAISTSIFLSTARIPCEQRTHFHCVSYLAKSSLCQQPFNFLSYMREIGQAIRKQNYSSVLSSNGASFAGIKKLRQLWSPSTQGSHNTRAMRSTRGKNPLSADATFPITAHSEDVASARRLQCKRIPLKKKPFVALSCSTKWTISLPFLPWVEIFPMVNLSLERYGHTPRQFLPQRVIYHSNIVPPTEPIIKGLHAQFILTMSPCFLYLLQL